MMSPAQEQNVREQEAAQDRMDAAAITPSATRLVGLR